MMKRWHEYYPISTPCRGERRRNNPVVPKLLAFFLEVLAAGIFLDIQLVPTAESLTVNSVRQTVAMVINESILKELNTDSVTYDDLINLQGDADGKMQMITTNTTKANEVKAKITDTVQKDLYGGKISTNAPLGTLLSSHLLYGRGPSIPLVVTFRGNVEPDFKTSSELADTNRTHHQIYLELYTEIYSFILGLHATTDVATSVLVTEATIIGDVP